MFYSSSNKWQQSQICSAISTQAAQNALTSLNTSLSVLRMGTKMRSNSALGGNDYTAMKVSGQGAKPQTTCESAPTSDHFRNQKNSKFGSQSFICSNHNFNKNNLLQNSLLRQREEALSGLIRQENSALMHHQQNFSRDTKDIIKQILKSKEISKPTTKALLDRIVTSHQAISAQRSILKQRSLDCLSPEKSPQKSSHLLSMSQHNPNPNFLNIQENQEGEGKKQFQVRLIKKNLKSDNNFLRQSSYEYIPHESVFSESCTSQIGPNFYQIQRSNHKDNRNNEEMDYAMGSSQLLESSYSFQAQSIQKNHKHSVTANFKNNCTTDQGFQEESKQVFPPKKGGLLKKQVHFMSQTEVNSSRGQDDVAEMRQTKVQKFHINEGTLLRSQNFKFEKNGQVISNSQYQDRSVEEDMSKNLKISQNSQGIEVQNENISSNIKISQLRANNQLPPPPPQFGVFNKPSNQNTNSTQSMTMQKLTLQKFLCKKPNSAAPLKNSLKYQMQDSNKDVLQAQPNFSVPGQGMQRQQAPLTSTNSNRQSFEKPFSQLNSINYGGAASQSLSYNQFTAKFHDNSEPQIMKQQSRSKLLNISESHQNHNFPSFLQQSLEDLSPKQLEKQFDESRTQQNLLKNPLPRHKNQNSSYNRAANHSSQGLRKQSREQFAQLNLSMNKFVMENGNDKGSLNRSKITGVKSNERDRDLQDIIVLGVRGKPNKSRGLVMQSQGSKIEANDANLPSLIMLQRDSKNRNVYRKFDGQQAQSKEKIQNEKQLTSSQVKNEKAALQEKRITKLQGLQAKRAQNNHSVDNAQKSSNNLQNSSISLANQLSFSLEKEHLANHQRGFVGNKKLSLLKLEASENPPKPHLSQSNLRTENQKSQNKNLEKERAQVQQSLESLKSLMVGGGGAISSQKQLSIKNDQRVQKIQQIGKNLAEKRQKNQLKNKQPIEIESKGRDQENILEEIIQTEEDMNEQQLMIYEDDDDLSDNSTFNSYANNPLNIKSHLINDTSNPRVMEQIKPMSENLYKSEIVKRDRPGTDIKKKGVLNAQKHIVFRGEAKKSNIFGEQDNSLKLVPMTTAQFGSESLISTSAKNYSDTTQATINPSIYVQHQQYNKNDARTNQKLDSQRYSKNQKEQSIYMLTFNNCDNTGKDLASREQELKLKLQEKEEEKRMSITSNSKDQYNQTSNFANFVPDVEITQVTEGQLLKTSSRSYNQNQLTLMQPLTGQIQLLRPNQSLVDPQDKSSFLNPSQYNKQSYEQDTFALSNSQFHESRDFGGAKLFSPDFQSNGKQQEVNTQILNSGNKEVTDFWKIKDYMNQDMANLGNFQRQNGVQSVQKQFQKIFEQEVGCEEDRPANQDPQLILRQSLDFNNSIDQTPVIVKRPFSMCNKTRSASQSSHKARPISCANVKNSMLPSCFIDERSQHSSEKMIRRNGSAQSQQRPPIFQQKPPHHLENRITFENKLEVNERSFSTNNLKQENGSRNKVLRSKVKTEIHSYQNNSINNDDNFLEETSNFGGLCFGDGPIRRGQINFEQCKYDQEDDKGDFDSYRVQEGNFMSAKKGNGFAMSRASKNTELQDNHGTFDNRMNHSNLKNIPPIPRAPQRRIQSSNQPYRKPVVSKKFLMKMSNDSNALGSKPGSANNSHNNSKFIHLIDIDQKSQESK